MATNPAAIRPAEWPGTRASARESEAPLVVVLMAVYAGDRSRWLCESLQSLREQTYSPIRVLVYEDGPLPAELERTLDAMAWPGLQRVRGTSNSGLAHGLNALIDLVLQTMPDASLIARMDSDDICLPDRFERQVRFLESAPEVDVLGGGCLEIDDQGRELAIKILPIEHGELVRRMVLLTPFNHPTVVFRRSVLEANVRYRTDTYRSEDTALWCELAERGFRLANIGVPLIRYRIGPDFYRKRASWRKGVSEASARWRFMRATARVTPGNLVSLATGVCLRTLPAPVVRFLYRWCRSAVRRPLGRSAAPGIGNPMGD